MLEKYIPEEWKELLIDEMEKDYFKELDNFVEKEYTSKTIYPAKENIFNALNFVSPEDVKVVILGQDPYHEPNQAHGLSFSVQDGVALPKSLINIFQELKDDLGIIPAKSGNLEAWAKQGVLLLNSVLTVENHLANSHKDKGWEKFTAKIIEIVLRQNQNKVFVLWGKQAQNTFESVYSNEKRLAVIKTAHPSPLSAYRGFFGSRPFSQINMYLQKKNIKPIDWQL
jgi:uracil-DNA glycosylase